MLKFHQAKLDNGLQIVAESSDTARSVAFGFFIRTGGRDELAPEIGLSHFLEHMMFKGTDRRSAHDVNREFDEMGAKYNAFTSNENTVYYGNVLPEFLPRLADLLADMMRPSLRQEDFDMEKKVILEEMAMYEDLPQHDLADRALKAHFGEHGLGNPVIGTKQSITEVSSTQMGDYFHRRYAAGNMVAVAAGALDFNQAVFEHDHEAKCQAEARVGLEFVEHQEQHERELGEFGRLETESGDGQPAAGSG